MTASRIIDDPCGAVVEYIGEFVDAEERAALLAELEQAQGRFDRDRVLMYGKTVDSPRMVCAFGDDGLHYRYAGVDRTTLYRLMEKHDFRKGDLAANPQP